MIGNVKNRLLQNLIGCWELNETSGSVVTDIHGDGTNFNNGTNNGATVNQSGVINSSYYFNASESDYCQFAPSTGSPLHLDANVDSFSVALWIKTNFTSSGRILEKAKRGTAPNYYAYSWQTSASGLLIRCYDGNNAPIITIGSIDVLDNEWHQVIQVVDQLEDKIIVYLDGSNYGETSNTISTTTKTTDYFRIFQTTLDGQNRYATGNAEQLAIWNRALTAEDARDIYNSGNGLDYSLWSI